MSTRPLCIAPRCRSIGYHLSDCTNEQCRGCQPRLAADGLRLCVVHTRAIADDAHRAAEVHAELALVLAASDRPGERTSGSRERGLAVNERAVWARATIRHTLVSWCKLIAEERGITLPGGWAVQHLPPGFIGPPNRLWRVNDTASSLARYLAKHADWLSASDYADEVSDELRDLAHGEPWRVAYPTGARVFEVGPCPETVDGAPCPGVVRAVLRRTDSLLPSELVCDHHPDPQPEDWSSHHWPADQWLTLGRKLRRAA
ncbi:MAG TPA: hypothetical protein VFY84_04855 [Jiangellales bacterium]|nr:hypothetical protein [Jiangellales bacterium]